MFGVKIRMFKVKESIHIGFNVIHIIENQDGWYTCPKVPLILDYESLKNSNYVKIIIRFIKAEESKFEILILL